MLFAKSTILAHFNSVGIVLFVFLSIVISLFAFCASQCHFNTHFFRTSKISDHEKKALRPLLVTNIIYHMVYPMSTHILKIYSSEKPSYN